MPKVLLVKMSSLGDVVHTLPAVTEAAMNVPGLQLDWVVEEAFAEIPTWHPSVNKVIPVALRRWRKNPYKALRSGEWADFGEKLRSDYDLVIDAQGLLKSAFIAKKAGTEIVGYDRTSVREPLSSAFYHRRYSVAKQMHAVERTRELFAQGLGYAKNGAPDYGLKIDATESEEPGPTVMFLHGTTWRTKHWPESFWGGLARRCREAGYNVWAAWGNEQEKERAERLKASSGVRVLPRMSLKGVAEHIAGAQVIVTVDTGLGHLAAALAKPTIALYGPTNPALTGIYGAQQTSLASSYHCAPCMRKHCRYEVLGEKFDYPPCWNDLSPDVIWERVIKLVDRERIT
ncbi:lipopolysaccharide heptosyltransferase I [Hahella chejuensis KCTC 2396]|uniref:Lipopolysaccharide heptosyltransferase 1 n=1 Tax=Hahella chejuensis (strain KCTC 2396) TaxID=349521 RepID=Q2SN45_HAHCH|nr:lipopolysaccharide heptosyltransferase I [Hahella chejuensis KCTC 2396]